MGKAGFQNRKVLATFQRDTSSLAAEFATTHPVAPRPPARQQTGKPFHCPRQCLANGHESHAQPSSPMASTPRLIRQAPIPWQ
jgi:hypothetical protein